MSEYVYPYPTTTQGLIKRCDERVAAMAARREDEPWFARLIEDYKDHIYDDARRIIEKLAPDMSDELARRIARGFADRMDQLGFTDLAYEYGSEPPGWDPTDPEWTDQPWTREP